jgi:hypothetical protein
MADDNSDKPNLKHLAWAGGIGGALGALRHSNRVAESKKSRAERDDPDWVTEVCEEIDGILDAWERGEDCETKDDDTRDLSDYLDGESDYEVELWPASPEGKSDILIGDALALELKIDPNKGNNILDSHIW